MQRSFCSAEFLVAFRDAGGHIRVQLRTVKFFVRLLRSYVCCFNVMQWWEGREGRGTLVIIGRVCANYTPYAYYIARIIYLFATYTLFSWPTMSYIQAQKSAYVSYHVRNHQQLLFENFFTTFEVSSGDVSHCFKPKL